MSGDFLRMEEAEISHLEELVQLSVKSSLVPEEREKVEDEQPYSVALKAESNLLGKESQRVERTEFSGMYMEETVSGKRKCDTKQLEEMDNSFVGNVLKKPTFNGEGLGVSVLSDSLKPILEHDTVLFQKGSAAIIRQACRRLRLPLKSHNPHIVFLMETKLDSKRMEKVRKKCGFMNGIDVQAKGSLGGLSLRFTDFYGSLVARDRQGSWELIQNFKGDCNMPWIIYEDFNEILHSHKKQGGPWFTWERGNLPKTNVRERLDRGTNKSANYSSKKNFSFEAWWVLDDSYKDVIREVWETTSDDLAKLEALPSALIEWSKVVKKDSGDTTKQCMMVQCRRQVVLLLWLFLILTFLVHYCHGSRTTKVFRFHQKSHYTGQFLGFLPRHFPIPASVPSRKHNDLGLQTWRSP
ncbi:hypothetical protein Godav_023123 [Gossypium davidsonii]|uniref:Endonuclease/exonuclease/phosphatase domain-containing protein n=1 Tax=Gossypium davidsonii TaxID=34287 RepID=A0A7J8SQI1_GOSDV|nr:hypothetical protein [Gossypium davidsonii]